MNGTESTATTGSRRERKKERTRAQIYAAAMELFLARGYAAVTIEDICQAADVARGTFFLHFPTKDALLGEYGRQALSELSLLVDASKQDGAAATLNRALQFLAERSTRHADVVRLVVRETALSPTAVGETTAAGRDLTELFASIIRRGQRAGELRRGVDPLLAGAVLASAYLAIAGEWARRSDASGLTTPVRDAPDLTTLVRGAVDLILRGLERRPR